jgi:hypothetical protein
MRHAACIAAAAQRWRRFPSHRGPAILSRAPVGTPLEESGALAESGALRRSGDGHQPARSSLTRPGPCERQAPSRGRARTSRALLVVGAWTSTSAASRPRVGQQGRRSRPWECECGLRIRRSTRTTSRTCPAERRKLGDVSQCERTVLAQLGVDLRRGGTERPGAEGHRGPCAPRRPPRCYARLLLDASNKASNKPVGSQRLLATTRGSRAGAKGASLQAESSAPAGVAQSVRAAES